ncbi:sulfite reductase [NADPH] flavoprotein component [Lodderomyces elongisporus]|nr:sulfite reductase [NADPH] flavoprotein component [Lodderomyces elongisporus]WLF79636.1 sulfite reductase [NADPH] flavoprotein component [Lodderomyces elongisporus]
MAPHSLVKEASSLSATSTTSSSEKELDTGLTTLINSNPFGIAYDPASLRGSSYTSATTIINQAIYSVATKIFSYETVGSKDILDSHIQLWSYKQWGNAFDVVPFFNKFEVRSGAMNAVLGYMNKNGTRGQVLSVVTGIDGLDYARNSLSGSKKLPLALNVSAIDFESSVFVNNYGRASRLANDLNLPTFTPVSSGVESQHLAILNHFFAFSTGKPSMFLFGGVESAKTFKKFEDLLSVAELGSLYQSLLDSADGEISIDKAFELLNKFTGKKYSQFEYFGSPAAETVFVVYGTHLAELWSKLAGDKIGVVAVRVPSPFNSEQFLSVLPEAAKKLVVISSNDPLSATVCATVFLSARASTLTTETFEYPLDFNWTPITAVKLIAQYTDIDVEQLLNPTNRDVDEIITANSSPDGKYTIWGKDNGVLLDLANKLALSLSLDNSKNVAIRNVYDNSRLGGVFQSQLSSTYISQGNGDVVDAADVVFIEDLSLLDSFDVLATAKPGSTIILVNQKAAFDLEKVPTSFKKTLATNENKLLVVDLSIVDALDEASSGTKGITSTLLLQLAFWRSAMPELGDFIVNKLLQANGGSFELLATVLDNFIKVANEKNAIIEIGVLSEWSLLKDDTAAETAEAKETEKQVASEAAQKTQDKANEIKKANSAVESGKDNDNVKEENLEPKILSYFLSENAIAPNPRAVKEVEEETNLVAPKNLAQRIVFNEAADVSLDLRPDLPVKNFVVKVQENKRLTPTEYSRNIFHIEFDITGTGLKYELGEALGVHARNPEAEVDKFLEFYKVDANSLVEYSNREDPTYFETKTAKQLLTDSVDFLGKPPKRFYESLAEFATDDKEKEHLVKIASAEGAAELKTRQEVNFDTYFDLLQEFKSARPSFAELIKIISPLKRREYSIASSQKIHKNAVHLLVVVVDWVDPKGRLRYGHSSKYLSDLKIGDELVVSVKPSVMKLPPLSTQPIVMSGLGTGLAPFKAFVEEKIWQQQQGMEIGDIYLYMGSRHKKEEYLYGELWEAYKEAGLLTHIGAAFSRDQPQKIYIQDKIRESIEELTDAIVEKNGSFYLCGPTWPVPDITACLEDIVVNGAKRKGEEIKEVSKVIEDMKEDGRYILEVY